MSDMEKDMIDETQHKQSADAQDSNRELVSTVTMTVLQTLQATGQITGEKKENRKRQQEPKTVDLAGMFFRILEKFWIILVSAAVCATVMGVLAGNSVMTYSATSKLYIVNKDSSGVNISDLQLGTVLTLDYQEVFKTWEVHKMVIEELDLPYSYQQMQSMLTVSNPEETRILYITVSNPDAKMAAKIANAYAKAAKTFIINTMEGVVPSDFSIALEPSVGSGANVGSSAVIGFVGGGVLAVAILAFLFVLDNRPRSPEAIQQYGGIPTLSVFPAHKDKHSAGKFTSKNKETPAIKSAPTGNYLEVSNFPQLDYVCNEAMNTLCTNLSYCGKDIRKIMITSRYAGEGKSYIAMNLLRTFSQLGKRTVLIDTDLRASGIQSDYRLRYSTQSHYGLSEYLSGICGLEEAVYQTNLPNTYMIPAGHEAPNPLQLLDTRLMGELIEQLAEQFDVVLVDTPPVGVLADAVALAKFCDGALLVVGYCKGKQQEIGDAVENIKQTGCKVLGAVFNGVKFNSMSNRHYYYSSERYASHYNKRYYTRKKKE
jgi:capsular exopolysaccharide synthesis family protein